MIAKLLGGTGNAVQLFYLMSMYGLVISPIGALITLLDTIPFINCIILPFSMVISLYGIYSQIYLPIKIVYGFDSKKAIITMGCAYITAILITVMILSILIVLGIYALS